MRPASPPTRRRRRFGQNFLVDQRVIRAIVDAFAPIPGEAIVEIGPGRGALTGPLLERGARVVALEIDRDLAREISAALGDRPSLRLVEGDALEVDLDALAEQAHPDGRVRLVANLPYSVATAILRRLLRARRFASAQVMVQDEVADRLTAGPGEPGYGPLAVLSALRGGARRLFRVPPGAFRPRPRVVSAVVRLVLEARGRLAPDEVEPLETFLQRAFAGRRKTMANSLRGAGYARSGVEATLEALGLPRNARAEQVQAALWPALSAAVARPGPTP